MVEIVMQRPGYVHNVEFFKFRQIFEYLQQTN